MLDSKHLAAIGLRHKEYAAARHEVIKIAGDAQGASKRAIFALHRDDVAGADALFAEAGEALAKIQALCATTPGLSEEGSYRAALEEYAEAALYRDYVKTGAVSALTGLPAKLDDDAYLGGLSDLTGELQRRQVKAATEGRVEEVRKATAAIQEIVEALLAMDLGGYLRTKFDQAKNSLRRAEDVLYEVTLRRKE
jgi:predicted translin family RNA/ssDNA-binding protein